MPPAPVAARGQSIKAILMNLTVATNLRPVCPPRVAAAPAGQNRGFAG